MTCALNIDLNPDQSSFRDKNMNCERELYLHRSCCNASIVIFADHMVLASHTIVNFGPSMVVRDRNMKCYTELFLLMMCCLYVILKYNFVFSFGPTMVVRACGAFRPWTGFTSLEPFSFSSSDDFYIHMRKLLQICIHRL